MDNNIDKTLSRLAAVQSYFQSFFDQQPLKILETEFNNYRYNKILDKDNINLNYDKFFFKDLILYIENFNENYDINFFFLQYLNAKRPFERLDLITKVILIVGTSEILQNNKLSKKIIINEYVNIANSFLAKPEVSMINAVLDKIYDTNKKK